MPSPERVQPESGVQGKEQGSITKDWADFNKTGEMAALKKANRDELAPIYEAHLKRINEENEVRKTRDLPPLKVGYDFTMDESEGIDELKSKYAPLRKALVVAENKKRSAEGKKPFPLVENEPEKILTSPEDYIKDVAEQEQFVSGDLLTYLPELEVLSDHEGFFQLSSDEVKLILKNKEWLLRAIEVCNDLLENDDKKMKNLISINDVRKGASVSEASKRTEVNFKNKSEVGLLKKRGEVLAKKIFFNKCLEARKSILALNQNYFSS
jgi:hypothetical protein